MSAVLLATVSAGSARSQVVDVTASLDTRTVSVGQSSTLRVFARVAPPQQANADRIFSWYVDVLNTNGSVATADYAAMQKLASDKDPSTSSTGTQEGAKIIMSDLTVSPEVGLKPGKYQVRVTRLAGGKETVFARTNLELKAPPAAAPAK